MPTQAEGDAATDPSGGVPPPPSETASLESYQPFASSGPDALLAKVTADFPDVRELMALPDDARLAFVRRQPAESHTRLFAMLLTIAFQLAKVGRYREAMQLNLVRLEIAKLQPEDALEVLLGHTAARSRGDVLSELANQHEAAGDLGAALAAALEAEQWFQRDADLRARAGRTQPSEFDRLFQQEDFRSLNYAHISALHGRLGASDQAQLYTQLAHQHSKRGARPEHRFSTLISQAQGAQTAGDLDRALQCYWEALDLALGLKSSLTTGKDVVQALSGLARIYEQLGLHRRALELAERSLAINERGGHEGRQQIDLEFIAGVYAARGDRYQALLRYEKSLRFCSVPATAGADGRLVWESDGTSYQMVRLEPAARVLLAMARLLRPTDPLKAVQHLQQAVDLVERLRRRIFSDEARISYQEMATDIFDELIELTFERHQAEPAAGHAEALFELMERAKSRVLSEMIADQPLNPPAMPSELLEAEAALLKEEQAIEARISTREASLELAIELDGVHEALEALWTRMEREVPGGVEYVTLRRARPITLDELRDCLRKGQDPVLLVNYYVTPRRVLAVGVASDHPDVRLVQAPVSREDLRRAVQVDPENPPALDLRLPYWELDVPPAAVDPVRPLVAGYRTTILVPHDALHSLPLHALASEGTQPLIHQTAISYVPSASVLRFCLERGARSDGPALVLGAPARGGEEEIPRAAAEATAVAAILGCEPRLGPDARCDTLLREAPRARQIHVACHNRFDEKDPLASALLLADGELSARDIFRLNIAPDMVVLSACQSGVSRRRPGDELIGIVRALMFAGAPSIVVSLWNAYDDSTTRLMADFYRRREHDGQPKATALCAAQREMGSAGVRLAEWAPFVVVGDWR